MTLRSVLAVAVASLVSLGGVAEAQYRWVDAEGRVHYSNVRPVTPAPPEAPEPAKPPADPASLSPDTARAPADPTQLIEEVLDLSGAKRQIANIPAVVQSQFAQRRAELRAGDYAKLSQVLAEAYRSDRLYQTVAETFKTRFDAPRALAVWRALRSPLFRKITRLEVDASAPEALPRIAAFAAELERQPAPPARLALIHRLDDATATTESNIDVMVATIRGIAMAIDPMLSPERRLKADQLDHLLADLRRKARAALQHQITVTLLYAYRPLTDDELTRYLAFVESDAGRWFTRVGHEGMLTAMAAAAEKVGTGIRNNLPAKQAAAPAQPVGASLLAQRNWALATSALLTERNGQRHDLLGGVERTEQTITERRRAMSQWWGVNNRADLFMVLKWLDEGGHRQEFEQLGAFVSSLSPAQYRGLLARAQQNDEAAHQLAMVEKYSAKLGAKSLLGWDYGRYVWLCQSGYLVGYLTEEEAWDRIMYAARKLQAAFDSWKDLGQNYLIGREFWSLAETRKGGQLFRDAYHKLLSDPGSPWNRYPWELGLDGVPARTVKASATR